MTLDELLLEWSYRTKKGYPCLDNPSDITILKKLLERLNLPSESIIDELEGEEDDDLDIPGTTGMEDSPVEKEKEDEKIKKNQAISKAKQDLIDIVDDNKEPVLNLSSNELEQLSRMIDKKDKNPLKEEIEDEDRIEDTEGGVINQIKNGNYDDDDLRNISSHLLGIKYKDTIYEYFGKGGKALLQDEVFVVAFNKMKETGDIMKFVEYIKNPISFREAYPGNKGNLITPFEKEFSTSFLQTLLEMDKGYSGISVGKGEYFLTLLCNDISFDSPYEVQGDLTWENKGLEIKNAGAKPTGQKSTYGPNSHDRIFTNALRFIKTSSDDPVFKVKGEDKPTSTFASMKSFRKSIKGRWPYKIATLYNLLSNENKKPFIEQVDKDFINAYKKLPNINDLKFSNFIKEGTKEEAAEWELEWAKAVVEDYQDNHKFDFVLFLNAKEGKGGYELMEANDVLPSLGLKGTIEYAVQIWAQDGLPRWTASSVF